jgi:hypothetical protein
VERASAEPAKAEPPQEAPEPSAPEPEAPVAYTGPQPSPSGDASGDPDPAAELLLSSEKKKLATCQDAVLVVEGRPRYHLDGCASLAGRTTVSLPAAKAIEFGFTPCSQCASATRLLVALRR